MFRSLLSAALSVSLSLAAFGVARAQSPSIGPVGTGVTYVSGDPAPTLDADGFWRYEVPTGEYDDGLLPVTVHTQTDVSDVYEWSVELRRWQSGDNPVTCPGDYVASQLYTPLRLMFSTYSALTLTYYGCVDFIDVNQFPKGGNDTYVLVSRLYRQSFVDGSVTVETITSPPFRLK